MKTNIVNDISTPVPYLAKFWFSSYGPKCCWPVRLQDSSKCNISRRKWMMKFIYGMQINTEVFYMWTLSFWMCVARNAPITQNKKLAYLCHASIKTWGMKLIFSLQISTKVFYKLIVSLWVCVARHPQSTQNNKFARSLQYLKENMKDEADFLPADKYQRFLQVDTIILGACGQACPNYTK